MKSINRNAILMLALALAIPVSPVLSQSVGVTAPEFSLQKLDGASFSLSQNRGKVVFIFLFGNTCSHCITNGPNTQNSIYKVFKDNPEFIALGIDVWDGNSISVQNFKEITGVQYPLCLNGSAVTVKYSSTYDRMLVIDQAGILRYKSTANATAGVVAQAAEVIKSLLGGSTGIGDPAEIVAGIKAYPNPAGEELHIQTPFASGSLVSASLVDISGRVVLNLNTPVEDSGILKMNISAIPVGFYYIRTSDRSTAHSTRISISR